MPVGRRMDPEIFRSAAKPQEWEVLTWFTLPFGGPGEPAFHEHLLNPILETLRPLGIEEALIDEISTEVAEMGENLRASCTGSRMNCANIRVLIAEHPHPAEGKQAGGWSFYIIEQGTVGSKAEHDEPCSYIDLHVFRVK